MPRSLLPAVPFALLTACASPPPPAPLPLGEVVATTYEGRIAPLAPATTIEFQAPAAAAAAPPAVTAAAAPDQTGSDTATVNTWLVALPLAEARAVLAGWTTAATLHRLAFRVDGRHVRPEQMVPRVLDWSARGHVVAAPFLSTEVGQRATMRLLSQTAAITRMQLKNATDAVVLDPVVERFEHGTELAFLARREGDALVVQIEWQQSEPVRPRTLARADGGKLGTFEVPVAMQQRLTAETKVAAHDALVLGPLPTGEPDVVLLLCVETDTRR